MATPAQLKAADAWNKRNDRVRLTLNVSTETRACWEAYASKFSSRDQALLGLLRLAGHQSLPSSSDA